MPGSTATTGWGANADGTPFDHRRTDLDHPAFTVAETKFGHVLCFRSNSSP